MNKIRIKKIFLSLFLFLLLAPLKAYCDELSVEASTDRNVISMGEQLKLTIKISSGRSGKLPTPSPPVHDDFDIIGAPYQSSSFSWVNGRVNSAKTLRYTLLPRRVGTFKVGEVEVDFKGEVYASQPVEVTVKAAALPAREEEGEDIETMAADPSGRIMVSSSLNKDHAYMGEGVVYTFSFFRRVRLWESPQLYPPDFKSFWVEEISRDNGAREVVVRGQRYIREDIKKILFPTQEGFLPIGSTSISVQLDPFAKPIVLTTKPLELEVYLFPSEPDDFSGAVGNFTISATTDRRKVKAGEPLTVKISIAGVGNIKALRPPIYDESEEFKGYEPKDSMEISTLNDLISGTKTFEYLFIPQKSGELTLPSFSFTYFDPEKEEYEKVETSTFKITVLKGEGEVSYAGFSGESAASFGAVKRKSLRPIRMKSDLDNWDPKIYREGIYLWLALLPPLALLGIFLVTRGTRKMEKRKKAITEAMLSLGRAEGLAKKDMYKEFFAETSSSLSGYLGELLDIRAKGETKQDIVKSLPALQWPDEMTGRIEKAFAEADAGRFSPTKYQKEEMMAYLMEVRSIIEGCEKIRVDKGGS